MFGLASSSRLRYGYVPTRSRASVFSRIGAMMPRVRPLSDVRRLSRRTIMRDTISSPVSHVASSIQRSVGGVVGTSASMGSGTNGGIRHALQSLIAKGFSLEIGPAFFVASVIVFVMISSIITLRFSTQGVTKGYVLRDLESKRQVLTRQNEVNTMQLAQAQSLDAVWNSDYIAHMRTPSKVVYARADMAVASR